MKRNKQQKLRMKIIQELHLNKKQQKILDRYIKDSYLTYRDVYFYKNNTIMLKYIYILRKFKYKFNSILNTINGPSPYIGFRMLAKMQQEIYNLGRGDKNV